MPGWAGLFRHWRTRDQQSHRRKARPSKTNAKASTLAAQNSVEQRDESLGKVETEVAKRKKLAQSLGVTHLGKFAHEAEMPGWLVNKLTTDGQVCTHDIIPNLARAIEPSRSISYAYLCHPCVQHVSKLRREGGFCGYRNIQSLISYVIGAKASGHEHFKDGLPSVFQIQDFIESAWDLGHNSNGRLETGGIRGTRKYIGTPEAQALFKSLSIPCSVKGFRPTDTTSTWQTVLWAMEVYFAQEGDKAEGSKVRRTQLPPVYLQHHGHSLTVVGFERGICGESYLYVFDPSSRDPETIKKHRGKGLKGGDIKIDSLIETYRRGEKYLSKYPEFEALFLQEDAAEILHRATSRPGPGDTVRGRERGQR